jgi:hypothetical protein
MKTLSLLLGVEQDHVVSAVKALLTDRQRLTRALEDAADRLTLNREDTRMLGYPATREERNARALLVRLAHLPSYAAASGATETAE